MLAAVQAALDGVGDASVAVLTVLGAILVMYAGLYGVRKVLKLLDVGVKNQQYYRDREGWD